MLLNLEHLKLLNVRGAKIERGTGGQPDVTWDDVAMMLLSVSRTTSAYARYRSADAAHEWRLIRSGVLAQVQQTKEWQRKNSEAYWETLTFMALRAFCSGKDMTKPEKARYVGLRWWKAEMEKHYQMIVGILSDHDAELRIAIREWNQRNLEVAGQHV